MNRYRLRGRDHDIFGEAIGFLVSVYSLRLSVSLPLRPSLSPSLRLSVPLSLLLSFALSLLTATRCAAFEFPSFNLDKYIPGMTGRTGEFRRPLKAVAFWTDTVRTADGQPAMRGFGGRLMFYDSKRGKPVKVAGTLVIYGFDEANSESDNPRPDRKYVFTPEQFAKHYSKCELGHSYSVWVPWDRAGGPTKEVSLICRFTPVEGGAVVTEQVKQLLPGVDLASSAKAAPTSAPVKLVQYQETLEQAAARRMQTTTIELNGPAALHLPTAQMRPRSNWPTLPGRQGSAAAPVPTSPTTNYPVPAMGQNSAYPPAENAAGQAVGPLAAGQQPASTAGRPAATATPGSWLARFGPHQPRVPGAPIVPPGRGRGPWQPSHVIPPSVPATTPTSNPAMSFAPTDAASPQ